MARKRALSRMPATIAAAAPPPAARTAVEPNCAAPANTNADMTIAASAPITGRATTPKDTPRSSAAAPKGRPARIPSRTEGAAAVDGAATRAGYSQPSHPGVTARLLGGMARWGYARRTVATTLGELIGTGRVLDLTYTLT